MSINNIKTIEGTQYKVTLNISGVADLQDYKLYGSSKPVTGCDKAVTDFVISEAVENTIEVIIPCLTVGTHAYQIFIKRQSTNQEFKLIEGRIEVSNRIGSSELSNAP